MELPCQSFFFFHLPESFCSLLQVYSTLFICSDRLGSPYFSSYSSWFLPWSNCNLLLARYFSYDFSPSPSCMGSSLFWFLWHPWPILTYFTLSGCGVCSLDFNLIRLFCFTSLSHLYSYSFTYYFFLQLISCFVVWLMLSVFVILVTVSSSHGISVFYYARGLGLSTPTPSVFGCVPGWSPSVHCLFYT